MRKAIGFLLLFLLAFTFSTGAQQPVAQQTAAKSAAKTIAKAARAEAAASTELPVTRVALYKNFIKEKITGNWTEIPALVHNQMDEKQADAIAKTGSFGIAKMVESQLRAQVIGS